MPRSQPLLDTIAAAGDERDALIGLDAPVSANPAFTFMAWHPDSPEYPIAQDVAFRWKPGMNEATWRLDISVHEDTNPLSFSQSHGLVCWETVPGLFVTVIEPDYGVAGVAFLPGESPDAVADGASLPDDLSDPKSWVALGRSIFRACTMVMDQPQPAEGAFEFAMAWEGARAKQP